MSVVETDREAGLALRRRPTEVQRNGARVQRYTVKAVWRTVQGEGAWAGRAAVFVRFAGCNLWTGEESDRERDAGRSAATCPLWCDTDFRKAGAVKLSAGDLVDEVRQAAAGANPHDPVRFVVLTGGEPLLQADATLIRTLHAAGFEVACETNGTLTIAGAFADRDNGGVVPPDWVVCSPKLPEQALRLEWADELKIVVPDYRPDAYSGFAERVRAHVYGAKERRFLWLQPEDGPRLLEATQLAVDLCLQHPDWRVSVQTHKILNVD